MDINTIKNIIVLGAGESGIGAALLAKKQGYNVFVSDKDEIKTEYKNELIKQQIDFEEKKHTQDIITKAELVVKSPGIADQEPVIQWLLKKNITVISEIEFAYYFTKTKIIGITGSNGKTTTTLLTYHILKDAGYDVACAGNVGNSFARSLVDKDYEYTVLEISSFQLDNIIDFKCHIAILLNITPDHLDRYHYNLEEYAFSKFKILNKLTKNDYFIYDYDDPITQKYINQININAFKVPISQSTTFDTGCFFLKDQIIIKLSQQKKIKVPMNILSLLGKHNRYNSMAAAAAALAIDVQKESIRKSLSDFQNIEHRLEFVANIHGKEFINDSKATNINATWYALESMTKPVIWIVGGIDKGNNYDELKPLVKEKVKGIVCMGLDNKKIIDAFSEDIQLIFDTSDIKDAVDIAYRLASENDVVLLSPACASFDLFRNYEDRGRKFKEIVRNL